MAIIEHEPQVVGIPAEVDEVGKVLLRAADIVREKGWWGVSSSKGEVCVWLAIMQSSVELLGTARFNKADERFARSLGLADEMCSVFRWNDAPSRTEEEVIEALERAAHGV